MTRPDFSHSQISNTEHTYEAAIDPLLPQNTPAEPLAGHRIKRKPAPSVSISGLVGVTSSPQASLLPQETADDKDGDDVDHKVASKTWTPPLLRRSTLIAFMLFLVLMMTALETLYIVSQKSHGLVSTRINLHYLWTYFPTAVFVLIMIYWRKVDFEAKRYQPWMDLASGPAVASKTMLVDYFTSMPHTLVKDAIVNRHFLALASFLVFNLFTLITIFSTGLMDTQILEFDDTSLKLTPQAKWGSNTSDWSANWRVQGIAESQITNILDYRLPYTAGVNAQFAIQPATPNLNLTTLGAQFYGGHLDVFALKANCIPATVYWNKTSVSSNVTRYSNISYVSGGCWFMMDPSSSESSSNSSVDDTGSGINCNSSDKTDTGFILTWIKDCGNRNYTFTNQTRLVITAYNCQGQDLSLFNTVCMPSYNISANDVQIWSNGSIKLVDTASTTNSYQLEGVNSWDLSVAPFYSSLKSWKLQEPVANTSLDSFVKYLLSTQPNSNSAAFYDNKFLQAKMNYEVPRLAVQLAHLFYLDQSLSSSDTDLIHGFAHVSGERLVFRTLATYLVQGSLIVVLICVIVMVWCMRLGCAPRSFGTIAGIAAVLADSPSVRSLLTDTGHLNMKQLRTILDRFSFASKYVNSGNGDKLFAITSRSYEADFEQSIAKHSDGAQEKSSVQWYRPILLRYWALGLLSLVTIAAIITLEVLLQTSQRTSGIVSVDPQSSSRYMWLYIPTLILSLINLSFGAIQFNLAFADRYFELSKKWSSADASVFYDAGKAWAPTLIIHGYRKSKWALVSASISVIFAPLLTIIASGLFSVSPVTSVNAISMDAATWIYPDPIRDTGFTPVAESIVLNNMSYPAGTYDELILPTLDLNAANQYLSSLTNVTIHVKVPALRAVLDGHVVVPKSSINITANGDACGINFTLPEECKSAVFKYSNTLCTWNYLQPGQYFAQTSYINLFQDAYTIDVNKAYGANCTVRMISIYGKMQDDSTLNYTGYVWTTGLSILDTVTTFNYPDLTVATEPQVDEGSSQRYSNWSPSGDFGNLLHNYEPGFTTTSLNDGVVQALMNNRNGFTRDQLMDPKIFVSAFQHVYRQFIAQILNEESRTPLSDLTDKQSASVKLHNYPATISHITGQRLQQSAISTRLLEAVLGILTICCITIILTIKIEKVMPKPLGSIAAVMSLLADSQLADPDSQITPSGTVWMSPKEMKKQKLWADLEFRMWWFWDDEKAQNHEMVDMAEEQPLNHDETTALGDVRRPRRRFGVDSRKKRVRV